MLTDFVSFLLVPVASAMERAAVERAVQKLNEQARAAWESQSQPGSSPPTLLKGVQPVVKATKKRPVPLMRLVTRGVMKLNKKMSNDVPHLSF